MTACYWRLTQPASRRKKKASGKGNAAMGPQLPQEAPTLQGWPKTETVTPYKVDVSCPTIEFSAPQWQIQPSFRTRRDGETAPNEWRTLVCVKPLAEERRPARASRTGPIRWGRHGRARSRYIRSR